MTPSNYHSNRAQTALQCIKLPGFSTEAGRQSQRQVRLVPLARIARRSGLSTEEALRFIQGGRVSLDHTARGRILDELRVAGLLRASQPTRGMVNAGK